MAKIKYYNGDINRTVQQVTAAGRAKSEERLHQIAAGNGFSYTPPAPPPAPSAKGKALRAEQTKNSPDIDESED